VPRKPFRPHLTVRIVEVPCADFNEREAQRIYMKAVEDLIFDEIVDEAETAMTSRLGMTLEAWRRYKGIRTDPIAELSADWEEARAGRADGRR
jgi:hypothetical protein